jgi:hypothetical protein
MATVTSSKRQKTHISDTYESNTTVTVGSNVIMGSSSGTVDGRDVSADGTKLDGIENGATADQTAAQILTAIKTVDGISSGLDADLLDGQSSAYYGTASAVAANTAKTGITSGQASAITANTAKISYTAASAVAANTAKVGISTSQASAITANTAKISYTAASAVAANTAKTGITSGQASAITANTAKTGISSGQASAITANTAKISYTAASAVAANTAKTGITSGQASAITANTAKTGISTSQSSAITANTAKISYTAASAVAANTAKTGITSGQASAITANTAKTGISSGQASAITANTAKISYTAASAVAANTAKTGITSGQASAITANTAKTGISTSQSSAITANTAKVTNSTNASDLASGTVAAARLSTANTQSQSDNSTKIATTAYVSSKITTLIGGAPSTLNDLNELAAAINDDANYNSTLTTALATKLPKSGGTMSGNIAMGDNDVTGIDQLTFTSGTYLTDVSSNYIELRYASTASGGIIVIDGDGSTQGYLYADGGASTPTFGLLDGTGSWAVKCRSNEYVQLLYDNAAKLQTASGGVTVTGVISATGGNSTNWNTAYGWGNHASAGYVTSSGNTIIGTDSDINTSGAAVLDQLVMTDGVITSHSTRNLTLANLGYTGATNANYITNNNQLTNGANYPTSTNSYRKTSGVDGAVASAGWVTVATNTSGRKHGEVIVSDSDSGDHAFIRIDWMRSYADSNYSVLQVGGHQNRITGVRVLSQDSDNTYGVKILQVYVATGSTYGVRVNTLGSPRGYGSHTASTPVIENTKSGYTVHGTALTDLNQVTLAAEEGIKTGGKVYASGGDSDNWNTAHGWGNHASAGYVTSSGNTIIGTDSDINTSGSTIVDNIYVTDGVITSMGTRVLTLANLGYTGATNANYITNNNQLTNGAGYVTSSGNTIIGTDSDINTSGAAVLDQLVMTDGVITSHSTRNLTLANLGYTGATNANYITNNNQLTNGAGYVTSSGNTIIGTDSDINTSGAAVLDQLVMTDGVITSHSTRNLTLANLGYTGATNANNYSLPAGSSSTRGGFKIGYSESGKNYPVELSSEKMYVNVPWTDTNTTYSVGDGGLTQKNFTTTIASAITANTAKTGISSGQASAITANTAKTGISSGQASAITANTAKTGITTGQASAITANSAKTGITTSQSSAITANSAKISYTAASAVAANTAKTGITSGQASAITANTAKISYNSTASNKLATIATSANNYVLPTTLSGSRTIGGDLTVSGNQVFTSTTAADVKFGVWNSTTYGIGMQPSVTYGGLNDYAMTFCMNNDSDRGFWWGYAGQTKSAGAMSLTTAGVLTVNSSIATGGLTATGDTGIGTTSPTELLHVRKAQSTSASVDPFLKLQPTSTTNSTGLTSIFLGCTTASSPYGISLSGWRNPTDNEAFVIKTHSGSASGTNRLVIKKNGYIGMGTDTPSSKLQVVGTLTATTKNFLIDNPKTGGELQYSVIESNEHGVCVRGESDQEEVQLPVEWEWLVHEDSVTVQLTSVGQAQDLFVLDRNNVSVKVGGLATDGKYSYVIYGTRKDVAPLEVNI